MGSLYPSSTLVDYNQTSSRSSLSNARRERKGSQKEHTHQNRTPASSPRSGHRKDLHHDLLSVGSQFLAVAPSQGYSSTAILTIKNMKAICPYHCRPLINFQPAPMAEHDLAPFDRYLAESPSDQYAVQYRSHITYKYEMCRCLDLVEGGTELNGYYIVD
jgi:hypothetical protein